MPRFDYNPTDTQDPEVVNPEASPNVTITKETYQHSVVDTEFTDRSSILVNIEGTPYNVDYYAQVLGDDEAVKPFDIGQEATFQQYHKINNMEIRLQGQLSQSHDNETNSLVLTGNAIAYPFLKPNVGDVFVSDIGDGRGGVFSITESRKLTRFRQSCYEIVFKQIHELTEEIGIKLQERVVKTNTFNKQFMYYGADPIVTNDTMDRHRRLRLTLGDTLDEYLTEFYSKEFDTLLVPSNSKGVYDPFVVKHILSIFNTTDHPYISKISQLNVDSSMYQESLSIWDCLVRQQIYLLDNCFNECSVINAGYFGFNPLLRSIAFSGVDAVVVPLITKKTVDMRLGVTVDRTQTRYNTNGPLVAQEPVEGDTAQIKSYPKVENTTSYVFSKSFYESNDVNDNHTAFEALIKQYLNKEVLDSDKIIEMVNQRHHWSMFERYYLMPVLFVLMIYLTRRH